MANVAVRAAGATPRHGQAPGSEERSEEGSAADALNASNHAHRHGQNRQRHRGRLRLRDGTAAGRARPPRRAPSRRYRQRAPGAATTGPAELELVENGTADLLAYGALFLANPDLPTRLAQGGPFNSPDPATFYGGGEKGFTDFPTLEEARA